MGLVCDDEGGGLLSSGVIGVLASSSPCRPDLFRRGLAELKAMGFELRCPLDPCAAYGSSSLTCANAQDRAGALLELLRDDEVGVIIAARGAYGSSHLLPLLDFEALASSISTPKCIVGASDLSALLVAFCGVSDLFSKGLWAIHGPMVSGDFARMSQVEYAAQNVQMFFELLRAEPKRLSCQCEVLRAAQGRGPIVAGNLTMLESLLGTPWDIDYASSVLVVEDRGESPYRIHRSLYHLRLAGKLDDLAGLVFGRFSACGSPNPPSALEVLEGSVGDILGGTKYPVLSGFDFGHDGLSVPLILGQEVEISGECFTLKGGMP